MASNSKFIAELLDANGDVNISNLDNLGTAATTAATDYATAAQGTKADTALQPTNNLSDLNNSDTALDNLGFSTFGKSLIDDADAAAVRTTLGLGEVATLDVAGGAQDFVATGAISAGQIVGLRSDGTVEVIEDGTTTQTENFGSLVNFDNSTATSISATFDSSQNKIVIAYRDGGNGRRGTAIVGTVSGTSISFGDPVIFNNIDTDYISATFDSNSNKVVIAYRDEENSINYGKAVVGTVSGTSISFGSEVYFNTNVTYDISATFDSNSNKVVIAYRNYASIGKVIVGTVSGTSISFGSDVSFNPVSPSYASYISATFDSSQNKVVIAYRNDSSSNYGTARVGTVSGTNISFGTPVVFESATTSYISATFDSSQNKVVIAYSDSIGKSRVGTVSGTSISFGSDVSFNPVSPFYAEAISATFDSFSNKVVIAYSDYGNSSYGTSVVGTVSGTSISFGTPVVFESGSGVTSTSAIFDSFSNKVVIAYGTGAIGPRAFVYTPPGTVTSTNAASWLGLASQNISDGGTGTVTILSGVNENQTGLTPNSIYYVNYDGTLTTTERSGPVNGTYGKIGRALSSTKLLITEGNA